MLKYMHVDKRLGSFCAWCLGRSSIAILPNETKLEPAATCMTKLHMQRCHYPIFLLHIGLALRCRGAKHRAQSTIMQLGIDSAHGRLRRAVRRAASTGAGARCTSAAVGIRPPAGLPEPRSWRRRRTAASRRPAMAARPHGLLPPASCRQTRQPLRALRWCCHLRQEEAHFCLCGHLAKLAGIRPAWSTGGTTCRHNHLAAVAASDAVAAASAATAQAVTPLGGGGGGLAVVTVATWL